MINEYHVINEYVGNNHDVHKWIYCNKINEYIGETTDIQKRVWSDNQYGGKPHDIKALEDTWYS